MGLSPASAPGAPGAAGPVDAPDALVSALRRPGAGLLLDLDGTLVDSEPMHRAAFEEYFAARGWDVPDDVVRAFAGRRAEEVFPVLDGPWRGEDPAVLTAAVIATLRGSGLPPLPVPGAVALLRACRDVGLPVAVVTSASREWAVAVVEALGAPDLPMVTAEDCTRGKPDAEPYRRGAAALRLDPGVLVAVEDAPAGLASADAAGIGVLVGVTTSHAPRELHRAHLTVPDLRPLAACVVARAAAGPSGAQAEVP